MHQGYYLYAVQLSGQEEYYYEKHHPVAGTTLSSVIFLKLSRGSSGFLNTDHRFGIAHSHATRLSYFNIKVPFVNVLLYHPEGAFGS